MLAAGTLLSWAFGNAASAAPPPKNPFGVGIREGGAPSGGIVGWILATQSDFYRRLTAAIRALASGNSAAFGLAALSFAYGVFHAAGPGHGKAVISAWILANENDLKRGLAMSFAAALLQAVVAVAIVAILGGILRVTAIRMTGITQSIELASFGAVALVGAALLWRKAGSFARAGARHRPCPRARRGMRAGLRSRRTCPVPTRHAFSGVDGRLAVFAAGVRPCSGAIIVLVFALAQGVFAAGVAAAFAMALGTALTTARLAALAVLPRPRPCGSPAVAARPAHGCWRGAEVLAAASCWRSARRCWRGSGIPVPPAELQRASYNGWTMKVAPGPVVRSRAVNSVRGHRPRSPAAARTAPTHTPPQARAGHTVRTGLVRQPINDVRPGPLCACAGKQREIVDVARVFLARQLADQAVEMRDGQRAPRMGHDIALDPVRAFEHEAAPRKQREALGEDLNLFGKLGVDDGGNVHHRSKIASSHGPPR